MPATVTTREVFPKDSTRESLDKAMQLRIQAGAIRSHVEDALDGKVIVTEWNVIGGND